MRILILGAFKAELTEILNNFDGLTETLIAKRRCMIAKKENNDIAISYTGVGTTCASSTTTALCEVFNPDLILMLGVAGGLDAEFKIGDLVLANKIIDADLFFLPRLLENTPYAEALLDPHTLQATTHEYSTYPLVLEVASSIPMTGSKVGIVVTSNIFPAPKSLFKDIKDLGCSAIEMESAGVFKAAQYYDIPVLTVRSISNLLDIEGNDLGTEQHALSLCAERLSLFLTAFLKKLPELAFLTQQRLQKGHDSDIKQINNLLTKLSILNTVNTADDLSPPNMTY